jgi:hypothetical protein
MTEARIIDGCIRGLDELIQETSGSFDQSEPESTDAMVERGLSNEAFDDD